MDGLGKGAPEELRRQEFYEASGSRRSAQSFGLFNVRLETEIVSV